MVEVIAVAPPVVVVVPAVDPPPPEALVEALPANGVAMVVVEDPDVLFVGAVARAA